MANKETSVKTDGVTPLSQERILDAACKLFVTDGANRVSLRRVAASLDVTPMALYRHFNNKEDLLAHVLRRGYEEFDAYLSREAEGLTGLRRLRVATEGFCAFALERGPYFDLMFLGRSLSGEQADRPSVRQVAVPTFKLLRDCVREAIDTGEVRTVDPQCTAVALLAQATGIIALHRTGLFAWTDNEARDQLMSAVDGVVDGIRS